MFADLRTAGDTYLRAEERALAYLYVVCDLHQVIDLHVATDDGRTHHRAVYRCVRTYLHIIFNDHVTYLRDFLVHSLCVRFKTEAVRTHYYSGVQDAVGADDAMRVHFHTRVENRVLADHDVVTDIRVRVDLHTLTQLHVLADIGEGTDIRVLGNGYSFADAHRLLNTLFGRVQRFRYQLQQHTHRAACVLYKNHRLSRVFESRT